LRVITLLSLSKQSHPEFSILPSRRIVGGGDRGGFIRSGTCLTLRCILIIGRQEALALPQVIVNLHLTNAAEAISSRVNKELINY
jgi:hypothetical protein